MTRTTLLAATILAASFWAAGVAQAQPVSGVYIGAAGGANFLETKKQRLLPPPGRSGTVTNKLDFETGVTGLGSIGYGFGNGLRLEIEGDYRNNRVDPREAPGQISAGGREQKYGGMFNALFDLDIGSPYVFPYLGGGVGYQWQDFRFSQTGRALIGGNVVNGFQNRTSGTDSGFAFQGIGGVAFPVPYVPGLSLTAEYRFLSLTGDRHFRYQSNVSTFSGLRVSSKEDHNHSLLLGVRYAFSPAPPPIEAPPPVAPPRAETARTYLVFFDWDRADLTNRARQIVAEAAQATTRIAVTRIEVGGHTDTSGTVKYNQALSVRRANNVAAELVRLGVPRQEISVVGYGESRPLVRTANGVREPQNRRVEIIYR